MKKIKPILLKIISFVFWVIKFIWNLIWSCFGVLSWMLKTMLGLATIGIICGCVLSCVVYIKLKPEIDDCLDTAYDKIVSVKEEDFMKAMDTYIYDKDGNIVGIINAGNFEYVDIGNISPNIQNMYISQEDKRFKEHIGVDWISIARAGLALVKNKGEITQGGSTITQQVIKNTYLTQEKSFKRKLIEILMAPQLEHKFSKSKIMEYYCNTNFYGNRCYGVQAASQFYFGKNASEVSVAEAALLVGLSNNPSGYDPIRNYDAALEKRNSIIENFCENGYINEDQKEAALNEPLVIAQKNGPETYETYQSTYALHCAALELMKKDGFVFKYTYKDKDEYDAYIEGYDAAYEEKTNEIRSGGYKIYTSLDSTIQSQLQESIDVALAKFDELQENGKFAMQGAAAIANNDTGYIVAIVGGRGTEDQYNRAYLSARQPGSSIKPLIDYTPAFETGTYYPSKIMDDHPIEGGPENSGGGYRGEISLREAVNRSINTVAWQVLQDIGVNNGLAYLGNMNFHKLSYIDNDVAALAIGGFTNGTRIVDMVKGYQTLANNGIYNERTCITEIDDSNDNVILKNETAETKEVYSADSAYLMTDVLKGTLTQPFGTGYGLALDSGIPAAGKTGTTNSNKDTWFCGYTRYYTTAVWVGYDTPREMPGIYGATYAGAIWKNVMDKIHTDLEPRDWDRPETVYESFYEPWSGEATEEDTGATDLFSRLADIRAEELEKEKQNEAFLAGIEKEVEAYEAKTISGPTDTYTLEEDFSAVNNVISQIEDPVDRNKFYNRIYDKYKTLLAIREEMRPEIELYEKQKADAESAAAVETERKAKEDRKKFAEEARENEVIKAIRKLQELEYKPSSNALEVEAKEALDLLTDYDSYTYYADQLEEEIRRINTLPDYTEYMRQKEIERAEEAARKAAEEAKRESLSNAIDESIQGPGLSSGSIPGPGPSNNPGYGPNYGPNYGPGSGVVNGPGQ